MNDMLRKFEPSEKEYVLTCRVVPHEVSYDDVQSQGSLGNITRQCIGLVPVLNDQAYQFFAAWLGVPGKLVEVLLRFDHPFHQYARSAVLWPKSQNPSGSEVLSSLEDHHLFLMSYGLEQIILAQRHLHGKEIQLTTCAESDDHPDGAPTDGEYKGEDLFSGTRKEVRTGLESPSAPLITDPSTPDRHGRVFPPLKR
jgi:hypothetical protein